MDKSYTEKVFSSSVIFKRNMFLSLAATVFAVGGFFVADMAFAAISVTPASNGAGISIDTTSAVGGSATFVELSGPAISESAAGDIQAGTHTLTLPSGWEFDTSSTVTVVRTAGNILPASQVIHPGANSFTFTISNVSTSASSVAFIINSLKVRPTGTTAPSIGNITYSGAGITGVSGTTNFGTLSTVPGTVAKLAFTTEPVNTVYGSGIAATVNTQDKFGNNSTNGLATGTTVALANTGAGTLSGTASLGIGSGVASFTGLKINEIGAKTFVATASATGIASATSASFEITKKPLTVAVTAGNKTYDGNTSATFSNPVIGGIEFSDILTLSGGTATFADANVATGKTVTVNGLTLDGTKLGNYSFGGTGTGTADIAAKPITIVANAQTKVYGEADPALTYIATGLVGTESLAGSLARDAGSNVAGYLITIGTLQTGNPNYAISYTGNTLTVTKRPITVTAVTATKAYDGNVTSSAVPTIASGTLASGDTLGFAQTYDNKNIGARTLTPAGIVNDGNGGANYNVTFTTAAGSISAKELTVSGLSATSKNYDGTAVAALTGTPALVLVVTGETVSLAGTAVGTFNTANAGASTVAVSGLSLTGADLGNYTLKLPTLNATVSTLPVTITPTASQSKIYSQPEPTFVYNNTALIGSDSVSGALGRIAGENVGTYSYTLGSLNAGGNYALALATGTSFAIAKKDVTVSATGINKIYDGSSVATVTLSSNAVPADNLTLSYAGASFADKIAANGKAIAVSGISISGARAAEYNLLNTTAVTTADISKKPISATLNLNNKTYDGDTSAVYSSSLPNVALNDIISGDVVTASDGTAKSFANKNVGTGKTVTATGIVLSNTDAGNYDFNGTGTGTANISVRTITVTAVSETKIYDGTNTSTTIPTNVGLQPGDTANFTQSYDTKNVGTGKTLAPTGSVADGNSGLNYAITLVPVTAGTITQKSLTVTAQSGTKVYDGTLTSSAVPLVDALAAGDSVATAPTQSYATKDVGTGKTLIASGLGITGGNGNYLVNYANNTTGAITPKGLTVSGAKTNSKVYDNTTGATVDFTSSTLSGLIAPGDATIASTGYSAIFDTKNVGTGKTVTVSGLALAGAAAGNYSLTQPTLTDGIITAKTLTVTATGVNKTYDANTTASVVLSGNTLGSDAVTLGFGAANFADANVGDNKTVTVSGISVTGGTDGGNYTIGNTVASASANIAPLGITITPTAGQNKVYGATDPVFAYTASPLLLGSNQFSGLLSRTANENVGTYSYNLGTLAAGANYALTLSSSPGTFAITPAPLVVTAENKIRAAGTADPALTYIYTGLVNGNGAASFTGVLSRVTGETLGDYSIGQGTLVATGNYGIGTYTSGILTIKNAPAVVSHVPTTSAVGVAIASTATITFSEPVTAATGDITISPAVNFSLSGSGTNTITLTPTSSWSDNTKYTITVTTGVKDLKGVPMTSPVSWSFTTAVAYSIPLTAGWNLISLPVVPENTAVASVLGGTASKIETVWAYDAVTNTWSVYHPDGVGTSNLTSMTAGYGYWVNYKNEAAGNLIGSGNLITAGGSVPPSRKLAEGWNLIGYYQRPSTVSVTADNALYNNLSGVWTLLFGYDNTDKHITTLDGNSMMSPGQGFWVWLTGSRSYTMGK